MSEFVWPQAEETLEISVADLSRLRDSSSSGNFLLLDCREPEEHALCRIESCQLVPLRTIPKWAEQTESSDEPIVVYCHHGMRSAQAAHFLRSKGFARAFSLAGGIEAWAAEIDPSVPRY